MPCSFCGNKFRYLGTTSVVAELSVPLRINVFYCDNCKKIIAFEAGIKKKSTTPIDKMPKYVETKQELTSEEVEIRSKHKMTDKQLVEYMKECKVDKS